LLNASGRQMALVPAKRPKCRIRWMEIKRKTANWQRHLPDVRAIDTSPSPSDCVWYL